MSDGVDEVICNISHRALLVIGATDGMSDPRDIFWACRDEIARAASDKFDRTARQQYEILEIAERDV
jgi:hypothetical protein